MDGAECKQVDFTLYLRTATVVQKLAIVVAAAATTVIIVTLIIMISIQKNKKVLKFAETQQYVDSVLEI